MDDIYELISAGFEFGQKKVEENQLRFTKVDETLEAYLSRAKETLRNRQVANAKPAKRFMKTIPDESESDDDEPLQTKAKDVAFKVPAVRKLSKGLQLTQEPTKRTSPENVDNFGSSNELRPIRTAKSKANLNMKEIPLSAKMRNDNNEVVIKKEPSRSLRSSSESIKENKTPANGVNEKRKSPDEGIQSAGDSEEPSTRSSKRSNSVEMISTKLVEVDLTKDLIDEAEKMPPPKKVVKKARNKQKPQEEIPGAGGIRITRSKIKQEKLSISAHTSEITISKNVDSKFAQDILSIESSAIKETAALKKTKKKYPLPILIKMEPEELTIAKKPVEKSQLEELEKKLLPAESSEISTQMCNETFNVAPVLNETVTIVPLADQNTTTNLTKNVNDSLMTEDNDDEADVSMEILPPPLPPKKQQQLPVSALKLKKNEVFNPYLSSPVKQRVQAFEKHAIQPTPDKFNTMPPKYNSLKSGTPSKISSYSKTTPLNINKNLKYTSTSASNLVTSSAPGRKITKPLQKGNSLSQEALDDFKKINQVNNLIEEKRKARDEKQRLATQQREAIEKEKREQALKVQLEREEKYRRNIREKEEKQRMDAMKKKLLKEKQAKKFAEEKSKMEVAQTKTGEASAVGKNDSLHLKMQKQLLLDRSLQKKKEESKNIYSFDMLQTDDSTDDESRPSLKRPPPPEWSKKKSRKPLMVMQSHVNSCVLDSFFSSQPISVDLREIFPAIDSKKLLRNSSAIWRTPPKQY